jgi:hypothetical protein
MREREIAEIKIKLYGREVNSGINEDEKDIRGRLEISEL